MDEKPGPDDIKELYARFGLAYYHAEVLHRGLCNLYCASQIPPDGPVTRPRVEEHLRRAFETTLGQLLLKLQPILPPTLVPKLERAVERRNFLAHHFWYERSNLMMSLRGVEDLVNELAEDTELFSQLDTEIEELFRTLHSRVGLTPEILPFVLADVLSGKGLEPLNQQRKPKKWRQLRQYLTFRLPRAAVILSFKPTTVPSGSSAMLAWGGRLTIKSIRLGPQPRNLSACFLSE
jgi:hypothetical protein